ncbi:MSHA biogenesis protein MshL [hydrothermal vent metagenome]|uniref:MSHA biogenesis protein MshL n=1 Tax=hydrothermal vent metagenome TaxID=652676 RepID=A0A3B1A7F2_9ZZZZ
MNVVFKNLTLSIVMVNLLLTSCASQSDKQDKKPLLDEINQVLNTGIDDNTKLNTNETKVGDITNALVPAINLGIPEIAINNKEKPDSHRFDIRVNRVKAKHFFMGLVDDTAMNMVLHPEIKGKITLDLKNVTVSDVMKVTRDVFGYDFVFEGNTYQVYPNIMRTKIFKINYLSVNRSGNSKMQVSSGQVTESTNSNSNSSSSSNINNNSNSGSKSNTSRQTVSGSSVSTLYKSDFWSELETSLKEILTKKEDRSVVVNAQSGIVVVRALSSELRVIENYLEKTQLNVQRQVILETKILEVELNDSYQTGINWAALTQSGNDKVLFGLTGGGSIFDNGKSIINGNTGNLDPSALSQVNGTSASAFGGVFSLALNLGSGFAAFIELLKSQGEVQVLSSPRISTINNQKAVIKVGVDEFFITDLTTNTNTSSATSNVQNNVEFTPFFSGVALDVIPQISDDGAVILHIHPTVSNVVEKIKSVDVSTTASLKIPLANSTIRESDSIIRAHNGQVVVIGGLMQTSVQNKEASVPLLGDIPLLGALFRHTQKISKKSELVILVKPIIVESNEQWNNKLRDSKSNFNNLSVR